MKLLPLPAFTDNYLWMLHDGVHAIVVDPGDAAPVLQALQSRGLQLQAILVTHHHKDHTGGVRALTEATHAPVYGPVHEPIPTPYAPVSQGSSVRALGLEWQVLDVPGHTAGHVAYFCPEVRIESGTDSQLRPVLFCGDTLFSGGCGRLFEGTATQMQHSLQSLAALPPATMVCCAHEYTLSNLKFACAVEPNNRDLVDYVAQCEKLRARDLPTLPSSIATERAINPFLRTHISAVAHAARGFAPEININDDVAVLAALREWKNQF